MPTTCSIVSFATLLKERGPPCHAVPTTSRPSWSSGRARSSSARPASSIILAPRRAAPARGCAVVLVNSNPATIMTDPEFADATYIEPITAGRPEGDVRHRTERRGCWTSAAVTAPQCRDGAADRGRWRSTASNPSARDSTPSSVARTAQMFKDIVEKVAAKAPARSSYTYGRGPRPSPNWVSRWSSAVLHGSAARARAAIVYDEADLERIGLRRSRASPPPRCSEESILGWKEYELELMRDHATMWSSIARSRTSTPMGVFTGDSGHRRPAMTLDRPGVPDHARPRSRSSARPASTPVAATSSSRSIPRRPHHRDRDEPAVSRSSALASKATGFPIAKVAAKRLAVGYTSMRCTNDITRRPRPRFELTHDHGGQGAAVRFEKFPQCR